MIKAEFYVLKDGNIIGFNISGHSGYEDIGKDIVCAAVSSATGMAINMMAEVLKADVDVQVDDRLALIKAVVSKKDILRCADILKGLKMHLILLEENYQDNIKVVYTEV